MEVALAREAVDVWQAWRPGERPSLDDKLAAIIYYAENDAWLPIDLQGSKGDTPELTVQGHVQVTEVEGLEDVDWMHARAVELGLDVSMAPTDEPR